MENNMSGNENGTNENAFESLAVQYKENASIAVSLAFTVRELLRLLNPDAFNLTRRTRLCKYDKCSDCIECFRKSKGFHTADSMNWSDFICSRHQQYHFFYNELEDLILQDFFNPEINIWAKCCLSEMVFKCDFKDFTWKPIASPSWSNTQAFGIICFHRDHILRPQEASPVFLAIRDLAEKHKEFNSVYMMSILTPNGKMVWHIPAMQEMSVPVECVMS